MRADFKELLLANIDEVAEHKESLTFKEYKDGYYIGQVDEEGLRHGYGIYYWTNGDFWYGQYCDGYRQGYGALFKVDKKIFYGKWIGDKKVD